MNPIQAADELIRELDAGYPESVGGLRERVEAIRDHAEALEAELARLREPGDGARYIVDLQQCAMLVAMLVKTDYSEPIARGMIEAAAYIERQAAALAHKTAVAEAYWAMLEAFKAENERMKAALTVLQLRKLIIKNDEPNRVKLPDDMGGDWIEGPAADLIHRAFGMIDDVATSALAAPAGGASDA